NDAGSGPASPLQCGPCLAGQTPPSRSKVRIPEGESKTAMKMTLGAAPRHHFNAALAWPAKLRRVGVFINGNAFDARSRHVQLIALHSIHHDLGAFRAVRRRIDKEGGNR